MLHVLMSAYNCDPRRGSDAQIGWRWATEIARLGVKVTVMTDAHNREAIELNRDFWKDLPLHFEFISLPFSNWPRSWRDSVLGVLIHPILWQWASLRAAREMLNGVDLIHHVTNATITHGNILCRLPRPFVFGPVGGGETSPPAPLQLLNLRDRTWERLKMLSVRYLWIHPLCRGTLRRAALVVCATAQTVEVARKLGATRVTQMLDYGAPPPASEEEFGGAREKCVILVGSMIYNPKKAYNLAREVLTKLLAKRSDIRVVVSGVYPDARALGPALVAHEKLELLGVQPYEKMNAIYRLAKVMFYPSFRESTGSALMEGLGHGLPIVGIRVNSRASLPPEVGVLVEPKEPAMLVDDLVAGIERIIDQPETHRAMSTAARDFATVQTWESHAQTMVQKHYPAALQAGSANSNLGKDRSPQLSVLLVSEPGVDGVFRHLEALAYYLLAENVRVHLAYSSMRGSAALMRLAQAVEAAGGETLDLRVCNAPGLRDIPGFLNLRLMVGRLRPTVIHAHSSKAGALARALAATGVKARYFYTPHAYYQMKGDASWKREFFLGIERKLARIGATIHVSNDEAAYARNAFNLPGDRQIVIKNGVPGDRFRPPIDASEKRQLRGELNLPEDALLLGTVARYSAQKEPIVLYRALIKALQRVPNLHFAHLGTGELSVNVDALLEDAPTEVRDSIHRIPSMEDTSTFYRMLDGFVLASRYEGLALSALEAASTNLPLILSHCPGNEEFLDTGMDHIGWVATGDADALEAQIVAWAEQRAAARSCNHRDIVLDQFSVDFCHSRLLSFYRGAQSMP